MLRFSGIGVSETGPVRARNEDSAVLAANLVLVADGVGGAAAGDVASATAAYALERLAVTRPAVEPVQLLRDGLRHALDALSRTAGSNADQANMATTLTALFTDGRRVALAHAGDSRAYLFRSGGLSRITTDHTYVQQLVDDGYLQPEAVRRHPWRHVVTRTLHAGEIPDDERPEVHELVLVVGDRLLLCSDGLTDAVNDRRLAQALSIDDAYAVAIRLAEDVRESGAGDNVTFLVVDVVDAAGSPEAGDSGARDVPQELGALANYAELLP